MKQQIAEYQKAAKLLMECLGLTYSPMAIKLAKDESEIPPEAVRPLRDLKVHYAECQCLAKSRTDGKTYALTLEDPWGFPVVRRRKPFLKSFPDCPTKVWLPMWWPR